MAKVYDRMEWGFLEGIMLAMGFSDQWVEVDDAMSLSVLFQPAEASGDIHGVRVARGAPAVTHLFFADDNLLFFRANQHEAFKIKECLDVYCEASGQLVNFEKSNVVFSTNTAMCMRRMVCETFGVQESNDLGRYLGLPSVLGLTKLPPFGTLRTRFVRGSARGNTNSFQGQGWRILIQPESLVSRLLKAKYFPACDFMEASVGTNPSYFWRGVVRGQEVLRRGLARRIRNGMDTKIWGWNWLSSSSDAGLHTPCVDELKEARVKGLMNEQGEWDVGVVQDLFQTEDVHRILSTPTSKAFKDSWRWIGDARGCYTVKHSYRLLTDQLAGTGSQFGFHSWNHLWLLPVPPKVKNLLWRRARNFFPVRENLKSKRIWIGGGCPFCGSPFETVEHIFGECSYATNL
ncbi:PREDICTED: uncharacterized protein LOC109152006 [Ipomoea nil]|uniref:uncharacterized protein LOC109152006 n=1 Tax=Ipomoea nil TaxID=35883 RepID=UPI0009010F87|nr:PREDICTED: uncharacterized protein LOC109152006 [Ipomoea nil]